MKTGDYTNYRVNTPNKRRYNELMMRWRGGYGRYMWAYS
jgi:hypothetical protein